MPWLEFSLQGHWREIWACGLGSAWYSWHTPTMEEQSNGQARLLHRGSSGGSGIIILLGTCSCGMVFLPVEGAPSVKQMLSAVQQY